MHRHMACATGAYAPSRNLTLLDCYGGAASNLYPDRCFMSTVRLILILALLVLAYSAALLIYAVPWLCLFAVVFLLLLNAKKGYVSLFAHGTARWASHADLERAGMLDNDKGLLLGRVGYDPPSILKAGKALFDKRVKADATCEAFVMSLRLFNKRKIEGPLVSLPNACHTAVFAPTGAGKGVSIVIPFLLRCRDSVVVIDPKGENYKITAEHRRKMGHRIVVLDPMHVVTTTPDTFDPLSQIDPALRRAIDDCRALALELVLNTPGDHNAHFTDTARGMVAAMIVLVVYHGTSGLKTLQTARQILAEPPTLQQAIAKLCASTECDGMVSRIGMQLLHLKDKELASVLSTVNRFLSFLDTPSVRESTSSTSFDPMELNTGKMTIYLVLPPESLREKASLMRMWIGSFLRAVTKGGLQEKNKVHFVLDEAASLGQMEAINDAVDKLRGYGVRLLFFYQSLGQLDRCFPDSPQVLLSNVTQVFFGVSEIQTAEHVSKQLGKETIVVGSGGTNQGGSRSFDQGGMSSTGTSQGQNSNWSLEGRELAKAEEIIAFDQRIAITFTSGVPPIWTRLVRYYEAQKQSRFKTLCQKLEIITAAVLLLGLSIGLAVTVTAASKHPQGAPNGSAIQKGNGR